MTPREPRCGDYISHLYDHDAAPAPATNFEAVAGGSVAACGLAPNGSGTGWGWHDDDLEIPDRSWSQLTMGSEHGCGIRRDGVVECWGTDAVAVVGGTETQGLAAWAVAAVPDVDGDGGAGVVVGAPGVGSTPGMACLLPGSTRGGRAWTRPGVGPARARRRKPASMSTRAPA